MPSLPRSITTLERYQQKKVLRITNIDATIKSRSECEAGGTGGRGVLSGGQGGSSARGCNLAQLLPVD